jgi:transposase
MTVEERIAELEAENAALREQLSVVLERVQVWEARLAKDSHHSGKPPASDGLARKTTSLRRTSGKQPGGQLGHRGETLRLVAVPDEVVEHRPPHCGACHEAWDAEAVVVLRERRQVQEVPPLRLHIHEQHVAHVRCPRCAHVTAGTFPPEAPSRVQ